MEKNVTKPGKNNCKIETPYFISLCTGCNQVFRPEPHYIVLNCYHNLTIYL